MISLKVPARGMPHSMDDALSSWPSSQMTFSVSAGDAIDDVAVRLVVYDQGLGTAPQSLRMRIATRRRRMKLLAHKLARIERD